jgi:hypothetical protein
MMSQPAHLASIKGGFSAPPMKYLSEWKKHILHVSNQSLKRGSSEKVNKFIFIEKIEENM